ncbi:MAG: hypothetical protein H3C43_06810, partial [Leptonema sp. (in: Bacteria)]|nr:hypothetical protein [Leptonema sp. (in: bacteria)]
MKQNLKKFSIVSVIQVFISGLIFLSLAYCSSSVKKAEVLKLDKAKVDGEKINGVKLLVGTRPITDIDFEEGSSLVQLFKPGKVTAKQVEDFLVEKSIVDQVAEEESIVVGQERIDSEISRRMEMARETSEAAFKERIERESKVPFRLWQESLRYQMVRQQIVQIKVTIPQPDEKEIEDFYKKNANRVGVELLFREIVFPPTTSIAAAREIESKARQVANQVMQNPASF